jgi:tellurite resistance protein
MTVAADLLSRVLEDTPIDDAILDAIALSACADGVTNVELVAILRIARELPSLRGREPAEIDARVHAAFDRLTADGLEGRLKALGDAALDDQTRRRMFTAAAVVQYADGPRRREGHRHHRGDRDRARHRARRAQRALNPRASGPLFLVAQKPARRMAWKVELKERALYTQPYAQPRHSTTVGVPQPSPFS